MELHSGYWQLAVGEMNCEKTAFILPDGRYQYKLMAFGIYDAAAILERIMDSLRQSFRLSTHLCYVDDIVI